MPYFLEIFSCHSDTNREPSRVYLNLLLLRHFFKLRQRINVHFLVNYQGNADGLMIIGNLIPDIGLNFDAFFDGPMPDPVTFYPFS